MNVPFTATELAKRFYHQVVKERDVPKHPIGLHAWPRGKHETVVAGEAIASSNWFGIGPVNWGGEPIQAWFDVRVRDLDAGYLAVNAVVCEACRIAGLEFINMAQLTKSIAAPQ